jgi:hypothetical protein
MSHVKKKRNVFWLSSSKSGWIELKCIKRKRKDETSSKSGHGSLHSREDSKLHP